MQQRDSPFPLSNKEITHLNNGVKAGILFSVEVKKLQNH